MLRSHRFGRTAPVAVRVVRSISPRLLKGTFLGKALRTLGLTVALAAGVASAQDSYFYSGGKKRTLKVSEEWTAVQADDSVTPEGLAGHSAIDPNRRANRVNRDVLIAPIHKDASVSDRESLQRDLKKKRGVRRALRTYEAQGRGTLIETGDIVVQFQPHVTREEAEAIFAEFGSVILRPLGKFAPNGYVARVSDESRNPTEVANAIYERGIAVFAHADFLVAGERHSIPNDPLFADQWYLNNSGSTNPQRKAGADIKALDAWRMTRGSGVTVAVLDDGFDVGHEEFQGKVIFSYDYFNSDSDASPNAYDYHGTPCAGLIAAAADNNKGIAGVAPEASLILMKVGEVQGPGSANAGKTLFGNVTTAQAFVDAADRGADVISCSWELGYFDVIGNAINYAATSGRNGRGCVILFSSGNDSGPIINEYAKLPQVIAVGATTALETRPSYSNYGPELDLVAPSAPGFTIDGTLDVITTDQRGAAGLDDGDYVGFGGTSAACPIAAGVAALVISKDASLTRAQVYQRLTGTADKIDAQNANYDQNGFSPTHGYGRVNALRAVAASDTTPPTLAFYSPQDNLVSREFPEIYGWAQDFGGSYLRPEVELVIYQDGLYWNGTEWVTRGVGEPVIVALPKPEVQENGQWSYTSLPTGPNIRSGVYHINASVYDAAGNANAPAPGQASRSFRIDRTPPTVAIASPANGVALTNVPKTGWIHGTASDDSGDEPQVNVYIRRVSDSQYWAGGGWVFDRPFAQLGFEFTEGTQWNCTGPLPGIGPDSSRCMAAGEYELIVVARDQAGNEAETKRAFTVEHTLTLPNPSFLAEHTEMLVPESSVSTAEKLTYPPLEIRPQRVQTPTFLRADAAGNYIAGMTMYERGGSIYISYPSAAVHKHNSAGEQLWRLERQTRSESVTIGDTEITHYYERFADDHEWREVDGSLHGAMFTIGAMELDATGNVYVAYNVFTLQYRQYATSSSGSPLFANLATPINHTLVVKFDPQGQLVWRRVIGPDDVETFWRPTSTAFAIKPMSDGSAAVLIDNSLYVQGSSYSPWYHYTQSIVARVGAPSGGFKKHFGFSTNNSEPLALEVDAEENLYLVTADRPQMVAYDYQIPGGEHVIRKLGSTGELLREVRIEHCDMPETWTDTGIDPTTGHLYIAGNHTISYENTGRQVVMKFDLSREAGQESVWRAFGPANGVANYDPVQLVLSQGAVFLASNCALTSSSRTYFTVSRFSFDGSLAWSRKYSTPPQGVNDYGDSVNALTSDESGNVYILGYQGSSSGFNQPVVRKISGLGDVQFAKPFPEGKSYGGNPDIILLPHRAAPGSIAVFYQSPEPGGVLLFSNPDVVYPPIGIPDNQPGNLTIGIGGTATFTVNASGSAPLAYQWRRHVGDQVQEIPGANQATLTLSNVQVADAGQYSVVVSNGLAAPVTSRTATLLVEATVPLAEALDGAGLTWVTGGSIEAGSWRGQTAVSYDGASAAVSGSTPDGGSSWIETIVTGPGTLRFRWKVSSQPTYDALRLYVDGYFEASISGSEGWIQHSLFIPEGAHTVRWAYEKDSSYSSGEDRAWLDDVSFIPSGAVLPTITQQPQPVVVAIGSDATFSVTAEGSGVLTYQWLKDGEELSWGTNATLLIPSVSVNDAGSYRVRVTGPGGSVLSDVVPLFVASDLVPPTVKINAPSTGSTVKTPQITVAGIASDDQGVSTVYVFVNRANGSTDQYIADGTSNWSVQVTLGAGQNEIVAHSVDGAGNWSLGASRLVTLDAPITLSITATSGGKVMEKVGTKLKAAPATSERKPGKMVKLVAKPDAGFIFAGWIIGNNLSDPIPEASLIIEIPGDLSLTARFIPSPFPALAGTYSGLISGSPASAANIGSFTFTVTNAGKVTGKLTYGKKQVPLKLALDATAALSSSIKIAGVPLNLSIHVSSAGVSGVLTSQSLTLGVFDGRKVQTFTKQNRPALEGRYTMLLDDPNQTGAGHATIQVTKTGGVKVNGAFADGDTFSTSGVLCEEDWVPLYATNAKAGKSLIGWLRFDEEPNVTDLQGTLTLFSVASSSGTPVEISGSVQETSKGAWALPGLESTAGVAKLTFTGGGLSAPLEQTVTLKQVTSKQGKLKVAVTLPAPNSNSLKLTVDPVTGKFTGSFKPQSTAVKFSGVLYQKQDLGEGQFKSGTQLGTVTLEPLDTPAL